jgi:hypothetical protein
VRVTVAVVDEELLTVDGFAETDARAAGAVTVRIPVIIFPFRNEVIVPSVVVVTELVVTVKLAEVAPAGMVTLVVVTKTGEPWVQSWTNVPPAGAGPVRVTVPVDDELLGTLPGFIVTEATSGSAVTVTVVVVVAPFRKAVIVPCVVAATAVVVTLKLAVEDPAGMVTLAGTKAGEPLVQRSTVTPPAGAGTVRATVPVVDSLPTTAAGFTETEERPTVTTGMTVRTADLLTVLQAAEMLTDFEAATG